ncbi:MAG: FG-GAP repeat protein [Elusimicrobia bacterium]|nr:FG-GAP repeat protein [Elusimicrobiota bacterium]
MTGIFCAHGAEIPSNAANVIFEMPAFFSDYVRDDFQIYAKGDYNGDGYMDIVAARFDVTDTWNAFIIPGGPNLNSGDIGTKAITTLSFRGRFTPIVYSADIDGDGYDDLIVSYNYSSSLNGDQKILVYYGSEPFPSSSSLETDADWVIEYPTPGPSLLGVAMGDVTGDGKIDLLIGSIIDQNAAGKVFVIPGTGSRRTGLFNPSTENGVLQFQGPAGGYLGQFVSTGKFNNDPICDIVLSIRGGDRDPGAYVIFGSTALPPLWDFSPTVNFRAPNVTLWHDNSDTLFSGAGDLDGDGQDEMYANRAYLDPDNNLGRIDVLIPGSGFRSDFPDIALQETSPNYQPVVESFRSLLLNEVLNPLLGDFDGDGRNDVGRVTVSSTTLNLSNDIQAFPTPTLTTSLVFRNILGAARAADLGDVNGDGFDDLVLGELGSTGTFWALVIYGFHPLDNPQIQFRERGLSPVERTVDFSVEGDPVEMRLDGNGDPSLMNRWLPFQPSLRLPLLPGTGTRTVGVIFRNRFGRESERAENTVILGIEEAGTQPLTTVLRRGGEPIRVECSLSAAGRIKVWVIDRRGVTLATLFDEERGIGLWPVEWDGRNDAGEMVAPGIYVFYIVTPHGTEKQNVVVQ